MRSSTSLTRVYLKRVSCLSWSFRYQYRCLIFTHIVWSWFVVLHLLDLLWCFLLSLLCLLFFLDFSQCLALLSFPQVQVPLLFPKFLVVRSSQEALRALCLPWDPAFLVIPYHRSSLLDLLYPRVLPIPACLAFPARYLILECQENHDRVLYKFLKIKMNCQLREELREKCKINTITP